MSDAKKYNEPQSPEPAVVFGRKDALVAQRLGDLVIPGLVTTAVTTGGIGKDSGGILALGYKSEAAWLKNALIDDSKARSYTLPSVILEENATNGGENARNSLHLLTESDGLNVDSLVAVAHATSARRLAETLKHELATKSAPLRVHVAPTKYSFHAAKPSDRDEALAEFSRLIDWPEKGWLQPQDLPENLVDFVRSTNTKTPKN